MTTPDPQPLPLDGEEYAQIKRFALAVYPAMPGSDAAARLVATVEHLAARVAELEVYARPLDPCALVTVDGDDGTPVNVRVLGGEEMDAAGHAAFGEIIRAAQRKHRSDLREAARQRDEDVRAVAGVIAASGGTWIATEGAIRQLGARFADRIAALGQQNDVAEACGCGCPLPGIDNMCCCTEPCPCSPCDYCDEGADGSAR